MILIVFLILFILLAWYISDINNFEYEHEVYYEKYDGASRKFLIVTLETRELKLLEYHNNVVQKYSQMHNYNYAFYDRIESSLPIFWQKLELVRNSMNKDYDYIVWLDSDTYINDLNFKLENIVNTYSDKDIFIGYDDNNKSTFNAGVFIIKNSEIGLNFLNDCIDYLKTNCRDENGNYVLKGKWAGLCYEQGIMNKMLKNKYKENRVVVNRSLIRNSGTCDKDPFIVHVHSNKNRAYNCFKELSSNG